MPGWEKLHQPTAYHPPFPTFRPTFQLPPADGISDLLCSLCSFAANLRFLGFLLFNVPSASVVKCLPFLVSQAPGFFIIKEQRRLPQPGSDQIARKPFLQGFWPRMISGRPFLLFPVTDWHKISTHPSHVKFDAARLVSFSQYQSRFTVDITGAAWPFYSGRSTLMKTSPTKLSAIYSFRAIGRKLGTAGQPTEAQFQLVHRAGFKAVINLALPTSDNALPNEGSIVTGLGMSYVHIPVDFKAPASQDFQAFCQVMKAFDDRPVFVHCAANMRVSAFVFLYRVLRQRVAQGKAERDLHAIWQPDEVWSRFIREQLDNPSPAA